MSILKSNKFNLSPEVYDRLRDALKEAVEELLPQDRLYPKTLGTYLKDLGDILFLGDTIDETEVVQFMAPISEYYNNKDLTHLDSEDDVE